MIALHPDGREEVVACGLAIGEAEGLCVSKIDALRTDAAPPMLELDQGSQPPVRRRGRARQLTFPFD